MPTKRKPGGTRGRRETKKARPRVQEGYTALGLRLEMTAAAERLGWLNPTKLQRKVIPFILAGRDVAVKTAADADETGAYALPVLHQLFDTGLAPTLRPFCAVVTPTRAATIQVGAYITALAQELPIRVLVADNEISDRQQTTALTKGREVIIGTPERLLHLLKQGYLLFSALKHCVLAGADDILDSPRTSDLMSIMDRTPVRRQTLLFCANLSPAVKRFTREHLFSPVEIQIAAAAPPPALKHELWALSRDRKSRALTELLAGDHESVLVVCRTRKAAGELARRLGRDGEPVVTIHAARTSKERERALGKFKAGEARVLIASENASRGLEIDDVDLVVNYDMPADPQDYLHRVARTARARRPGLAVTLCVPEEEPLVQQLESQLQSRIARRAAE